MFACRCRTDWTRRFVAGTKAPKDSLPERANEVNQEESQLATSEDSAVPFARPKTS